MNRVQPGRVGLIFAMLLAGWHLLWALLVAAGWAQPLLDFLFWIHFIKPVYVVQPFNAAIALLLIVVTSVVGYVFGWASGMVWNKLHKKAD